MLATFTANQDMSNPMTKQNGTDDGSWILTYTGKQLYPLDIDPGDICIEDIAHALSLKCRYGGHCREFYSVAQHCCLAARYALRYVPRILPSVALLHDAAEAYLIDMPTPVKSMFHGYVVAERIVQEAIFKKYLPSWEKLNQFSDQCDYKPVDEDLLTNEMKALMANYDLCYWGKREPQLIIKIIPWPAKVAEETFISIAHTLGLVD